jgi:hypothetical protein
MAPATKPVPVTVNTLVTPRGTRCGDTENTDGRGAYGNDMPLDTKSCPLFATSTVAIDPESPAGAVQRIVLSL